jgi:putative transposase
MEKYSGMVNELLEYASNKGITSFKRLKAEKYHELRAKNPELPSHYIYTACQTASWTYKSFRKLKRRGKAHGDRPFFKKSVVMLDDHLFTLNLEKWEASIATSKGRISVKLMHGTYHEKFKGMRVGEAWLTQNKKGEGLYLRVVFSLEVEAAELNEEAVAVDLNENNITFGSKGSKVKKFETKERTIRAAYFLKRRRLQSEPRLNEEAVMEKYRGREGRRMDAVYHRAAKEVVDEAKKEGAAVIVLEKLKGIRESMNYSKQMNGRLHRWSFRKLQSVVEYKAKLNGLTVVYVDARGTSSLCPECGVKLRRSLRGYRLMRCPKCGMEEDRDVIAVRNLLLKYNNTERCACFIRSRANASP